MKTKGEIIEIRPFINDGQEMILTTIQVIVTKKDWFDIHSKSSYHQIEVDL